MDIVLRDYQSDATAKCKVRLRAGARRPLVSMPTGAGKTTVFAHMAAGIRGRGQRCIVIVHRRELRAQAVGRLRDAGIVPGEIAPGQPWRPGREVQVASVLALLHRLHRLARSEWAPDWLIVDEAHHALPGSTWGQVLDYWPAARTIGFTATPQRLDGLGLGVQAGGYFDALVEGPTVAQLVEKGYLAPIELHVPGRLVDADGVPVRGGDYVAAELAAASERPGITGDAVAYYRALAHQLPAIAFCSSVGHAERIAEAFRAAGYRWAAVDGGLRDLERHRRLRDFASGQLHGLASCDLISEGLDVPEAQVCISLRATQSLALALQQWGRVRRMAPGKDRAILIDSSGNVGRHRHPDFAHRWSLDGARAPAVDPEKDAARRGVRRGTRGDDAEPRVLDGQLIEVAARPDGAVVPLARQRAWDLGGLDQLARSRGFAPGWAAAVHRARAA